MLAGDDQRLCTNYTACKQYQMAYRAGNDTCAGCGGDISPHRALSSLLDKHIDLLAGMVHNNTPEVFAQKQVEAWTDAKGALTEHVGGDISMQEVVMLFASRAMQRIATLEEQIRIAALR